MKKTLSLRSVALLTLILLLPISAQAEQASGQALAFTCAGCHGTNGASTGPATPSIGGMSEIYLTDAMLAYKNDERGSTIMGRIAKGYTDDEIAAMAVYFAEQDYVPAEQEFDADLAAKGEAVHEKNCSKCHEDGGTSADDDAGFLQGQWSIFLKDAFADFHSEVREMPKKMKKKMKKLDENHDANMAALIEYYKSH